MGLRPHSQIHLAKAMERLPHRVQASRIINSAQKNRSHTQPQIKTHQQGEAIQLRPRGVELNLKRRVEFAEGHERLTIVQRKGLCDQDRFQIAELAAFKNVDIGVHIEPVAAAGDFDFFREASAHM